MKAKERLDRILAACGEKMQEEVSALLGKQLSLSNLQTRVVTKTEYFEEPAGKSVLAHVQLEGELTGQGCLLISVQDAIRIGGTLIMLPDSELQAVIADVDYTEELQDSYGEVANILCGSLTSTFEEQYPKNFRLVRTEQEVIVPAKVDVESDQPIPPGSYYIAVFSAQMGDDELGGLQLLLPAEPFGLVAEGGADEAGDSAGERPDAAEATGGQAQGQAEAAVQPDQEGSRQIRSEEPEPVDRGANGSAGGGTAPPRSAKNLEKQKKLIDGILKLCFEKTGEEVGALLGATLSVNGMETGIFTKEELLDQAGGKQVLNRMDIRGSEDDAEAFLFAPISGAIRLGGSLIMLPESELDETVRNEEFGEDAQDAYGEIANIIAGVYTFVFEEQHRKKFGFVKTTMETVVPVKVDPDSDEVIPNRLYYLCSGEMLLDEKELGRLQVVFPASLFELEGLAAPEQPEEAAAPGTEKAAPGETGVRAEEAPKTAAATGGIAAGSPPHTAVPGEVGSSAPDILIFSDDTDSGGRIADVLAAMGYTPSVLHFKSSVNEHITDRVRLVFLVMREVSEQGFGVAIKISSSRFKVPLVAAGPAWTRSLVIKAVKYGADDILITPPTEADVREKVDMNLVNMAA